MQKNIEKYCPFCAKLMEDQGEVMFCKTHGKIPKIWLTTPEDIKKLKLEEHVRKP